MANEIQQLFQRAAHYAEHPLETNREELAELERRVNAVYDENVNEAYQALLNIGTARGGLPLEEYFEMNLDLFPNEFDLDPFEAARIRMQNMPPLNDEEDVPENGPANQAASSSSSSQPAAEVGRNDSVFQRIWVAVKAALQTLVNLILQFVFCRPNTVAAEAPQPREPFVRQTVRA